MPCPLWAKSGHLHDLLTWRAPPRFLVIDLNKTMQCVRPFAARDGKQRKVGSVMEGAMNQVQVEQKSYQMPPQEGFTIAHFLTVADVERSARYYEKVFGARI